MIKSLILRRFWLWKNRLVPSIFLFFLMPFFCFTMISLPLKNIIRFSLAGDSYDVWNFHGLIFLIGSISLFPIIYRDFFDLRIHRKVLINITLSPHSKFKLILNSLIISIMESVFISTISCLVFISFIPLNFDYIKLIFMFICLVMYLFIIGNLYITISLIIDSFFLVTIANTMLMIYIIFGVGFVIEFPFFPSGIEQILKLIPISFPFQIFQQFKSNGLTNFSMLSIIIILIYLWSLLNSKLLKFRLQQ